MEVAIMDFASRFALFLKQYVDKISRNVWKDFESGLIPECIWGENEILRTSILRDGFNSRDELDEANKNPVYSLEVETRDYGGNSAETLTGADLAIVFQLEINQEMVAQRMILVQLKRAYFAGSRTSFKQLHYESGESIFGRDISQAERMLLFTDHAYFWLALTSGIRSDKNALKTYIQDANLRQVTSYINRQAHPTTTGTSLSAFSLFPMDMMLTQLSDHDLLALLTMGLPTAKHIQDYRKNLAYTYWHTLQNRLQEVAFNNVGMVERLGLMVCHAESVLGLADGKINAFTDVYPVSIPFTQFILSHILANDVGDSNKQLIDCVLNNNVQKLADNIRQAAKAHDLNVAKAVSNITHTVGGYTQLILKTTTPVRDND
jgi:hypothetical protein